MKTQIIQLDSHDDIISTRDKMGWGKTRRLLLVWSSRGRILTRRLDLLLLLRQAQVTGAQLALVTRDPNVSDLARQLGIPVFDSTRQAQETRWKNPLPRRSWKLKQELRKAKKQSGNGDAALGDQISLWDARPGSTPATMHPAIRLAIFSIGVLAFLSIAAALIPGAEIALSPQTEIQAITIDVTASASADRVYVSGLVPIRALNVIVEGQGSTETTGVTQIPEHAASGQVRFTNLTDQAVTIPGGTIVSTPDSTVRFTTDRAGIVQAGAGKSLTLPVTALHPGNGANLAAHRITAIVGSLGVNLAVTNPLPTTGGSNRPSPAPNDTDRNQLSTRLESNLQISASAEIKASLQPDDLLLTPLLSHVGTIEEIFEPPDTQPASTLTLDLQIEYKAQVVSGDDLITLASAALNANLPPGYTAIPGTIKIQYLTAPVYTDYPTVKWKLHASQEIQAQPNEFQAAYLTLGLTPVQAGERLSIDLPLAAPPEITLKPSWWPRLPIIPFRIRVSTYRTP